MDDDGNFKVIDRLNGNSVMTNKEVWNVKTNQFMPVSVVCYSQTIGTSRREWTSAFVLYA